MIFVVGAHATGKTYLADQFGNEWKVVGCAIPHNTSGALQVFHPRSHRFLYSFFDSVGIYFVLVWDIGRGRAFKKVKNL